MRSPARPQAARAWSVVFVGVLLATSARVARAERLPLKAYTTADGLPGNEINCIRQDSRGFIWFCTDDGLSRFDGYSFTNLSIEQGLPGRVVFDLLETSDGRYWVATDGGLVLFDPRVQPQNTAAQNSAEPARSSVLTLIPPEGQNLGSGVVNVLAQVSGGPLWVGTNNGLYRVEEAGGRFAFQPVGLGALTKRPAVRSITDLLVTRDGTLWVATPSGLYARTSDGTTRRFSERDGLPSAYIHDLFEDHEGRLWAATRTGGFFRFSCPMPSGPCVIGPRFSTDAGLPSPWVFRLFETKDHTLWAGAAGGLVRVLERPGGAPPELHLYSRSHGLSYHEITALAEDGNGDLWLGTNTAGAMKLARNGLTSDGEADGLLSVSAVFQDRSGDVCVRAAAIGNERLNHAESHTAAAQRMYTTRFGCFDGTRFQFFDLASLGRDEIGWVLEGVTLLARNGEWWVGTGAGLYRYPSVKNLATLARVPPLAQYGTESGLEAPQVYRLFEDSRGDVWVSTIGETSGLARWDRRTGRMHNLAGAAGLPSLSEDLPRAFGEDAGGRVWIGFNHGAARADGTAFTFYGAHDGLPPGAIVNVHGDRSGRLWLASAQGGLIRVDHPDDEHPTFARYTAAEGLSSNRTEVIAEDRDGRIYVGTARALDRLDPVTRHIRHFTTGDGLAPGMFRAALADSAGVLWFGTTGGLSRLVPTPDSPSGPVPVLVTRLTVGGALSPLSALGDRRIELPELEPYDNQIRIEFVALDYMPGRTLRYQYRLEGGGGSWSLPSEERSVDLFNLPPGRYQFWVRAVTADDTVSAAPALVTFAVRRPIWARWWFLGSLAVVLGLVVLAGHLVRFARVRELSNLRARIGLDLHDDIGTNLTRIAILSEVARQQLPHAAPSAEGHLASIARISRESVASMSDLVWAVNPQRDRLTDLLRRMRRHAEDAFACAGTSLTFSAPASAPYLRLNMDERRQVFLIFKEAISNVVRHARASRVEIRVEPDTRSLTLEVIDNGVGFDLTARHEGNGLFSIRRRARQIGGIVTFRTAPGGGTSLNVRIPLAFSTRRLRSWRADPTPSTHGPDPARAETRADDSL